MTSKPKPDDHKDKDDHKPDEHEHKPGDDHEPEEHKPGEYKPEPEHKPEPDAAEKPPIVARDEAPPPETRPPNYPYPPAETIVDEQRERSKAIQAAGVEKWKGAHDERPPDAGPKQVPGVGPSQVSDKAGPPESWEGSTRSTPEARQAQHGSNR